MNHVHAEYKGMEFINTERDSVRWFGDKHHMIEFIDREQESQRNVCISYAPFIYFRTMHFLVDMRVLISRSKLGDFVVLYQSRQINVLLSYSLQLLEIAKRTRRFRSFVSNLAKFMFCYHIVYNC